MSISSSTQAPTSSSTSKCEPPSTTATTTPLAAPSSRTSTTSGAGPPGARFGGCRCDCRPGRALREMTRREDDQLKSGDCRSRVCPLFACSKRSVLLGEAKRARDCSAIRLTPAGQLPPSRNTAIGGHGVGAVPVPRRKVLRRMERIEDLPPHKQTLILKTIDTLLKGATANPVPTRAPSSLLP